MSGDNWKYGLRDLGQGVYADDAGGMHIDEEELLRAHGYPVNEHNRMMIRQAAREQGANYHEVEHFVCARCGASVSDPATHSC